MKGEFYTILFLILITLNIKGQTADTGKVKKLDMIKIEKSDDEWKKELSSEQYQVLRQCGTELPGTGKYDNFYEAGQYLCAACGQLLFDSGTKYHSGSGWPSFYDVISGGHVTLIEDRSLGMTRTEVRCSRCGSHLGHVFNDGPAPTHLRYCINSAALKFVEKEKN
jgi:peptide-methionine (R)-S-oxide reductase